MSKWTASWLLLLAVFAASGHPVDPGEADDYEVESTPGPSYIPHRPFSPNFSNIKNPEMRARIEALWMERYPSMFFTPPSAVEFHCEYDCKTPGYVNAQYIACERWKIDMNSTLNTNCTFDPIVVQNRTGELDHSLTPVIPKLSRARILEIARKAGRDEAYVAHFLPKSAEQMKEEELKILDMIHKEVVVNNELVGNNDVGFHQALKYLAEEVPLLQIMVILMGALLVLLIAVLLNVPGLFEYIYSRCRVPEKTSRHSSVSTSSTSSRTPILPVRKSQKPQHALTLPPPYSALPSHDV